MKKIFCLLLVFLFAFSCLAEGTDDMAAFIAKYEQSVAFNAAKTLARVGTDDLGIWSTDRVVKKSSDAWDRITHFDAGWFSSVSDRTYSDYRSENWVKTSDTTFECDVYMNNTIRFSLGVKPVTFPCAYHLSSFRPFSACHTSFLTKLLLRLCCSVLKRFHMFSMALLSSRFRLVSAYSTPSSRSIFINSAEMAVAIPRFR